MVSLRHLSCSTFQWRVEVDALLIYLSERSAINRFGPKEPDIVVLEIECESFDLVL